MHKKKSCKIYAGKVGWEILFQYFEFNLITWLFFFVRYTKFGTVLC